MLVQKIPAWMTHLSPCRTRVAVNVLEEFNDPDRVPFALDAGDGALNHRLVKVEFQFLWLRGAEGIPVRFPNALRAGGIKLHDTIEIPPVVGNPNASWIARVMAPSGRSPQAPCRERRSFHSAAAVAMSTAMVGFISNPAGADIEVDGAFLGSTPADLPLALGQRTVIISKKGFKPYQRTILVLSGGAQRIAADLQSE